MSNDAKYIEIKLGKPMPSYVPVSMYAVLFGLGLSFELYIGNPTAIIYALVGIGFGLNYLMCLFYRNWIDVHNKLIIQQVAIETAFDAIEKGTFPGIDGLIEGDDDGSN